jgi:tRNA threonylcarbamoyladenosine biosynthesis protein TsaB
VKILAFDTSNNTISVAISDGYDILSYIQDSESSSQAEKLLPLIEEALMEAKLTYQDIEYLAVTNGPGSFTGIRVGLACAKGLLIENNIKATAVNNFEIYYYRAKQQVKDWDKIITFLNANRSQLYVQVFNKGAITDAPQLLNYEESIDLLKNQNPTDRIICAGSGADLIYQDVVNLNNITILPRFTKIKALHICRYIYENLSTRTEIGVEPLYIVNYV